MTSKPAYDLSYWRRRIPLLGSATPLNNCSQAPQFDSVRAAADGYLDSWNHDGMDWDAWITEVEAARATFARLIGAEAGDVAVVSSVSHAVAAVATALDFGSGRNVVVASPAEFPTVGHVWLAQQQRGAQVRWVERPEPGQSATVADFTSAIDSNVRIVSVAHGDYQTGARQDVAAITAAARAAGALTFVDAYQTMGTRPIDVREWDVDFLATGNLKYLLGAPGIAFLYVRREVAETLQPAVTGWFGQANPYAFDPFTLDPAPGARRFDSGTPAIVNAAIARAGMEIIEEVGPGDICDWIHTLVARIMEKADEHGLAILGPGDAAERTPATAFHCSGDSHQVEATMRDEGFIVSARGPAVRLAPHFYNTLDDVEAGVDLLRSVMGRS